MAIDPNQEIRGPYIINRESGLIDACRKDGKASDCSLVAQRACDCNASDYIRLQGKYTGKQIAAIRKATGLGDKYICLNSNMDNIGRLCITKDSNLLAPLNVRDAGSDHKNGFCYQTLGSMMCLPFMRSLQEYVPNYKKRLIAKSMAKQITAPVLVGAHNVRRDENGLMRLATGKHEGWLAGECGLEGSDFAPLHKIDISDPSRFIREFALKPNELKFTSAGAASLIVDINKPVSADDTYQFCLTKDPNTNRHMHDQLDGSCEDNSLGLSSDGCERLEEYMKHYRGPTPSELLHEHLSAALSFGFANPHVIVGGIVGTVGVWKFYSAYKKKNNNDDDQPKPPPPVAPSTSPKSEPGDAPDGTGNIEFQMQPEPMILVMAMKMAAEAIRQLPQLAPRLAMQSAGAVGSGMSWASQGMARVAQGSARVVSQAAAQTAMRSAATAGISAAGESGLLSMLAPAGLLTFSGAVGVMWASQGSDILQRMPKESRESAMESLMQMKTRGF